MSNTYFPDGFPKDPQEAIEAAFFLSEEEKVEWRTWLPTANEAEQLEFIDTLHSIYIDQKSDEAQTTPSNDLPLQNPNAFGPGSTDANFNPPVDNSLNQNLNQNPAPQTAPQTAPETVPAPQTAESVSNTAPVQEAVQFDFSDLEKELESQILPEPTQEIQTSLQQPAPVQPEQAQYNNFEEQTPPINTQSNTVQQIDTVQQNPVQDVPVPPVSAQEPESIQNNDYSANSFDLTAPRQAQQSAYEQSFDTVSPNQPQTYTTENFPPSSQTPIQNFSEGNIQNQDNLDYQNPSQNNGMGAMLKVPKSFGETNQNNFQNQQFVDAQKRVERYDQNLIRQDQEIEEDIDNMLAPTKNRFSTPIIEALDDDYVSEAKKDERYQKTAKVSLLSAKQVNELYDTFLSTQSKSTELEREYQARQANLFDKIMEMVTEASVLSDKVLRLNDISVDQAREIKTLKIQTANTGSISLQSQINTVREEVRKIERTLSFQLESIERELSTFRAEISDKVNEMSIQLSSALSDTYKSDGVNEKIAKLTARLDMVDGKGDSNILFKESETKKVPKSKSIQFDENKDEDDKKLIKSVSKEGKGISIRNLKK